MNLKLAIAAIVILLLLLIFALWLSPGGLLLILIVLTTWLWIPLLLWVVTAALLKLVFKVRWIWQNWIVHWLVVLVIGILLEVALGWPFAWAPE